jgi:hypothetical protein
VIDPLDHMGLVRKIAYEIAPYYGLDPDDLIADGYIRLCYIIKHFKPELGYQFSTYAHPSLKRWLRYKARGYAGRFSDRDEKKVKTCQLTQLSRTAKPIVDNTLDKMILEEDRQMARDTLQMRHDTGADDYALYLRTGNWRLAGISQGHKSQHICNHRGRRWLQDLDAGKD